nr:Stem cell self-renewal protein Piwi domain containing protein [Haemonchus contortus]
MLSPSMKAEFIKKVCRKPDEHKRLTDKLFEMMEFTKSPSFINSFLFDVRPEMIRCKGLLLEPPVAIDKERNPVEMTPIRAIKKKELNEPPDGEIVMAVLVMQGKQNSKDPSRSCVSNEEAKSFFNDLKEKCRQRGMSVASEPLRVYFDVKAEREEFKRVVKDASDRFSKLADGKILLLLVINEEQNIPDRNMFDKGPSYGLIKSVCDNEHGIASQVVDASTVRKATSIGEKTIYYNIALKINAKLGGVNQAVVFDDESQSAEVSDKDAVMYVGIDVTHPTNLSTIDISIASIVANVDLAATRYTNEIMAQMAARETVERFETQFVRLMTKFHQHSKVWPRHIVIFRDGVSDSEMLRTAFIELKCLRDSWNKLTFEDPQLEPTFTYIVIQKRHLTRFYQPTKNDEGEETYVNVSSGTVVDNVVVSPTFFDFYLASQIGALGTTRPAHYTVVRDDWMLTPDKIYEMCYRLCFLYARCRIPVSLPCPVYYAHRVCEKAKEVYKSLNSAHKFDGLSEMEKKQKIEQCLTVPENYPGMHFV